MVTSESEVIATHVKELQESQEKIKTQEDTLNQKQRTLEKVTYAGTLPFEFTMTNFEEHRRASDVWHSPPFYTHAHDYRMCITVYTNGWGQEEKHTFQYLAA